MNARVQTLTCIRRPNPLWASVVLLVAVSGVALAAIGEGRQDAARRVRAGGTRGVGVIHQVRVEPYGRAAREHAYFDDDELAPKDSGARTPLPRDESPIWLLTAAALRAFAAPRFVVPPPAPAPISAGRAGIPAGRAPPVT